MTELRSCITICFTHEQTESQRCEATCPKSSSWKVVETELKALFPVPARLSAVMGIVLGTREGAMLLDLQDHTEDQYKR